MNEIQTELWVWAKYIVTLLIGGGLWKAGDFLLKWKKQTADQNNTRTESGLKAFQVADESLAEWIDTAQKAIKDLMIVMRLLGQVQNYVDDLIQILNDAADHLDRCDTPDNPKPEIARLKRQIQTLIEQRSKLDGIRPPDPPSGQ
jgi:hypothetical protein